ncbi:alpha/beta-hydrolase [Artomyces pyxidatus]|uniref:Alpha/beta-hydrolase n=1 Tax=Artomyces pyxidatus TaxID=48021 RepID=A0ACB8TFU9_9AGAM|nr:alpha/beta-hydrolase [Artomyces pyxidatus]
MLLPFFSSVVFPVFSLFFPEYTPSSSPSARSELHFELRHSHAVTSAAHVYFSNVGRSNPLRAERQPAFTLRSKDIKTYKPLSAAAYVDARKRSIYRAESEVLHWDEEEVPGPDVESRESLLMLARMTSNAYNEPDSKEWYDLEGNYILNDPIGWKPDADGFRGYVFATPDNSTVILSIKGTSAWVSGGGPTTTKDKINDNLLFSCCCARVDWTWTTVCDCHRGGWKCDQECVEQSLVDDSLFYPIGTNLYNNLTYMYPNANIWLTGHSLGGALASLLGVTFGAPVVAFESPGEKMAAQRLHLPSPPSLQHITHVYHTADPIPMGTCTGVLSSCAIGGFALESSCHLGKVIRYDTVSNLSWSVNFRTHSIVRVIEDILSVPWAPAMLEGREVPEARPQDDCVECYRWEYGNFTK